MDNLALELAKFQNNSTWDMVSTNTKNAYIEMASRDIAFLRSHGFKQVEAADEPANMFTLECREWFGFEDCISGYRELNPRGLYTGAPDA
jgi:hypothetical protein